MRKHPSVEMLELFAAIFEEKNLSLAANRCEIPMSTASRYLSELRLYFDDLLFSRCRDGLVPTQKSIELSRKIFKLLDDIHSLAQKEVFDPFSSRREVRIGCVDNGPYSLFPDLVNEVHRKAPGLTLTFLPFAENRFELLRHRELDFLITPMAPSDDPEIHMLDIGLNEFVLVGAPNHPLAQLCSNEDRKATDEEVLQYGFIDVLMGSNHNPKLLRSMCFPTWTKGHSVARSCFFLAFIHTLIRSNLLMVLPLKTALMLRKNYGIEIIPTESVANTNNPKVIWHSISHNDPLMQWMRSMIVAHASGAHRAS